jgi:hypothetical protein
VYDALGWAVNATWAAGLVSVSSCAIYCTSGRDVDKIELDWMKATRTHCSRRYWLVTSHWLTM